MVLRILFLAVLIWLTKIVVSAQSPQPNEPHTVVDYYMHPTPPIRYFSSALIGGAGDAERSVLRDIGNGRNELPSQLLLL